jgi:hypothetical protein
MRSSVFYAVHAEATKREPIASDYTWATLILKSIVTKCLKAGTVESDWRLIS